MNQKSNINHLLILKEELILNQLKKSQNICDKEMR